MKQSSKTMLSTFEFHLKTQSCVLCLCLFMFVCCYIIDNRIYHKSWLIVCYCHQGLSMVYWYNSYNPRSEEVFSFLCYDFVNSHIFLGLGLGEFRANQKDILTFLDKTLNCHSVLTLTYSGHTWIILSLFLSWVTPVVINLWPHHATTRLWWPSSSWDGYGSSRGPGHATSQCSTR